ncbi:MAG: hypothetical protein IJO99_03915 [Ruminococcus sp.]|nr:hypothetical protein [Ruminococcus sp.]
MKKSVYSIVLMDDVIRAVDAQAYRLGTSRSNLINQILAEHLSCVTPEMRMRDIFATLESLVSADFKIQQQRSESFLTLKTALEYKYRPTINYKVELARAPDCYLGNLTVSIRTQSAQLIALFDSFFAYWIEMEMSFLAKIGLGDAYVYELSQGCFRRKLINTESLSKINTGEALNSYILLLDKFIKAFFSAPQSFNAVAQELENLYSGQLDYFII